jgi:putative addiction module component (TIGR02574 family)
VKVQVFPKTINLACEKKADIMLRDDYKNLSIPEKIILVEEIWDSIGEDAGIDLSASQKSLLASREKDLLEGKVKTKTWGEIKKRLKKRKT